MASAPVRMLGSGTGANSGEWLPGFEYDAGNLVEYAGGLHVAVQPTNDNQPPHRGNGWVTLTGA